MKLNRLYSNRDDIFLPLEFNAGLNVLYARVLRPKEDDKDSHNLGKTLLIHLLDFLLLKKLTKGHFLYDHRDRFVGFQFYLQLLLNDGRYVTVRRDVERNTKISIAVSDNPSQTYVGVDKNSWGYYQIPIDEAISKLNQILNLSVLGAYNYRKGVSYFLRTQNDYVDVFQLSKFMHGRHSEWKPFMAMLLGFSEELVRSKYDLDDKIQNYRNEEASFQRQSGASINQLDRINGMIAIRQQERRQLEDEADRFNYYRHDSAINTQLIDEVESEWGQLNDRIYTINYDLETIETSLNHRTTFDINRVAEIFEQAQVTFPEQLKRSYSDLQDFYRRLSYDRNSRLRHLKQQLIKERDQAETRLHYLDVKRSELLGSLREADWFKRYSSIQRDISRIDGEITRLQFDLEQIDVISRLRRDIKELQDEQVRVVSDIAEGVAKGNNIYYRVRTLFNNIVRDVLEVPALLSTSVNSEGNLEFDASILEDEASPRYTSEGKGTSYKKLLCAAFDMSLLETYSRQSFYRFVYHDGILEGLDNRKKNRFLNVVQRFCTEYNLQYILSVIDADLPRTADDEKIPFQLGVIIREFHENGDDGRLFNMPKF